MKKTFLSILILVATVALVHCGSSNVNGPGTGATTCVGTGCTSLTTAATTTFTGGDTETFVPVSNYVMEEYVGTALNNPTGYQVNIALSPSYVGSTEGFFGQMIINFVDGSTVHTGTFTNGTAASTYTSNHTYTNNVSTYTNGVYRIFFEDPAGALVLVLTPETGGDTVLPMTGAIYFANFNSTAPNPLFSGAYDSNGVYHAPGDVYCWMIVLGPYNCRNFNVPPTSPYVDSGGTGETVQAFNLLGTIPTVNTQNALGI